MKLIRTILCLIFLGAAAGFLTGCATDDETASTIPWNTPPDWSGPLPSSINNGR